MKRKTFLSLFFEMSSLHFNGENTSPLASSTGKTFSIDKDFFFIYIFLWQMHMIIAEAVPALRKSVADTLPDWIESPLYNTSGTDSYKSVKIWSIRSTKHSLLQGTICTAWQVYAELMVFVQCLRWILSLWRIWRGRMCGMFYTWKL